MADAADDKSQVQASKKRVRFKLVVLVLVVLVLAGGGAAGFVWWKNSQAAAAVAEPSGKSGEGHREAAERDEGPSGLLPLEPFVVNLADAEASRFLRVDLRLVLDKGEAEVKELEENKVVMTRMRSRILEVLSTKTSEELVSSEGKEALKKQIEHLANGILPEAKVRDVLFVEFVVQF